VWRSHVAKYRSLMPSLALIGHLIDGVAGGPTGPVSGGAAARAVAWCAYLQGHARRLYASVTDQARVAAALLAARLTRGRLPSPFTARDVYRNEWTGLAEPRVVQGALACLEELGWLRSEAIRAPDGGRPTVRFRINPRLLAGPAWPIAQRSSGGFPTLLTSPRWRTAQPRFCQFGRVPAVPHDWSGLVFGSITTRTAVRRTSSTRVHRRSPPVELLEASAVLTRSVITRSRSRYLAGGR
jgi:hypothetical protein